MSDSPPPPPGLPLPTRPEHRIDGRYELIEIAGRGGMAVVWRAIHHGPGRFSRKVAVKQMHPHLASDEIYRHLFEEEGRVGSLLQDPNIAQVLDFVIDDGEYFLVMEWVNGIDLATYVRYRAQVDEPSPWSAAAAIGIGVLRALHAAHDRVGDDGAAAPIVHRDVSPHNILINDKGRAKLIDFGLSFSRDRSIEDTDPGMAKGKLAYLAPEVVRGSRPTPHSDQFAMGSVLWEVLVGRRAFEGGSDLETYRKVANAEVEPLAEVRPDVPEPLCAAIHRALALDPADRFGDTVEMAVALGEVLKELPSEDLYGVLEGEVEDARTKLGIGQRTQDPAAATEIEEVHSGLVELLVDQEDKPSGFMRWIPKFIRNITG